MKKNKNKIFPYLILLILFTVPFFINPQKVLADCSIQSAKFTPSGNQNNVWYRDSNTPNVRIDVVTDDCVGKIAEISIVEDDTVGIDDDIAELDDVEITIPSSNFFSINLLAGETDCESFFGDSNDCEYFIKIDLADGDNFSSDGESGGNLNYECDGLCDKDWIVQQNGDSIIIRTQNTPQTVTAYTPLAPLPGFDKPIDTIGECPFGNYLNVIIKLILGIAAVLAMVMIVMGGIEYMTSDLISSKESGKETIRNAILGLMIALGAYLILNTINPKLLDACLNKLPKAEITILPYDQNINSYMQKTSGNCSVITSGNCSVENLRTMFGDKADKASMICNVESGGIASSKSNSDYCSVGQTTFSFGLFQINLLAHGDKIPSSIGNCANLFTTSKGEEIGIGGKGYVAKDEKGNYSYDCKLKPERGDDYNKCSDYLKTASGNLSVASMLFQARVFEDWRPSDQGVCPAAFK